MIEVISKISNINESEYNKLGNKNPFLSYDFLKALETSGCASEETGWAPFHLMLRHQKKIKIFIPGYLKYHSFGEFVFDHAWADFYHKIGLQYYPKLLHAIPFTPVRSSKILIADKDLEIEKIIDKIKSLLEIYNLSSAHFNFIDENDRQILVGKGFIPRISKQYIWRNDAYKNFDTFLETLTSRKRKMISKERQYINKNNIKTECIEGINISEEILQVFYQHYIDTNQRKWGNVYLNYTFFKTILHKIPNNILLIVAKHNNDIIGTSLHLKDKKTLYGRYWGASNYFKFLHFELCYYQAIEYAIAHNMDYVEAGAGGAHKITRGYAPIVTYSAHFFKNKQVYDILKEYIEKEVNFTNNEIHSLTKLKPFKKKE
tara:strand:- start:4199 stop:5320 length:1122 start_codon:yes stop_codon:yes gene_type:complete